MRLTFRPLVAWTDPETKPRKNPQFSASWTSTLELLGSEVDALGGDYVVLEVLASERDMRIDGGIKADARVSHPGVVVSFESKHGPLRFACDTFENYYASRRPDWQGNTRAIALGLQALRRVDRYGIAQRGEQFRGWSALPPVATALGPGMNPEEAARLLAEGSEIGLSWQEILKGDSELVERAFRLASKLHHPDQGGSAEAFDKLVRARTLLSAR